MCLQNKGNRIQLSTIKLLMENELSVLLDYELISYEDYLKHKIYIEKLTK